MASNVSVELECKIPVFTVLKNNAIFKNIFILNKSPSKKPNVSSSSSVVKEHENILLVGRHPDCDITLTHPSISRFHLQIRSKPSSQSISIIDLSSVHGTWVSGKKVEPGASVEMKEGDTLRIGASSRVYRLSWVPISRAYDLDEPFVSEVVDVLEAQNEGREQVQGLQNFKCCPDETEEDIAAVEKDIPAAPPLPDDTFSFCCPEDMKSSSKDGAFGFLSEPCGTDTSCLSTSSDWENELCDSLNQELSVAKMEIPMPEGVISFCCEEEMRSQSNDEMFGIPNDHPFGAENGLCDSLNQVLALPYVESFVQCGRTLTEYLSESVCFPVVEAVQRSKMQQLHNTLDTFTASLPYDPATFDGKCAAEAVIPEESKCVYTVRDDEWVRDITVATEIFNSENTVLQVEEVVCDTMCQENNIAEEIAIDSLCDGQRQDTCDENKSELLSHLNAKYCSLGESVQDIRNTCNDIDDDDVRNTTAVTKKINSENTFLQVEEVVCDTICQQNKVVEEIAIDSLCDGPKQDTCAEENKSELLSHLNAKYCSLDESVQDTGNKCKDIDDEQVRHTTAVTEKNNSENTFLQVEEVVCDTICQQNKVVEEIAIDSLCDGPKQDTCTEENKSELLSHLNAKYCSLAESVQDIGNKCNDIDDEQVRDTTAVTEKNNSENTVLQVEEVVCDTICQQNKVVEEIAIDSLCDGPKQDTCAEENKPELLSHLNAKYCSLDESVQDIGNKCEDSICPISYHIESVNLSTPQKGVLKITEENPLPPTDIEFLENCGEQMGQNSTIGHIWSRKGEAVSAPQIRTSNSTFKSKDSVDIKGAMSNVKDITKTILEDRFSFLDNGQEEEEIFTPDKENISPNTLQLRFLKKKGELEKNKHSKRNSKDTFSSNFYTNESIISNLRKENQKDIIRKTVSKDLFSHFDGEEEICTPDKENFSPNTHQLRLLKKNGKLKGTKFFELSQKSKENSSPNIYSDVRIGSISNKENQTLKVGQEQKSRRKPLGCLINMAQEQGGMASNRVERVPFQVLNNFGGKSKSKTSYPDSVTKIKSGTSCPVSATKNIGISDSRQILDKHINFSDIIGDPKERWDMVVDTASLMNRESRKALQLLQGLKGTRLIIPRLVIGELNCMKKQFSIFRRTSEASLALEWIEECMVKTNGWIHIQRSMVEEYIIVPRTQFSLLSISFHTSSVEVASPTVEDGILDFVRLYRRKQSNGQLVLLSEDVTLKIKCMAEGLLCESASVFRDSLVNPFSERFLWANSSPRGRTWSCEDDVVLREKYCPFLSKKSSKGAASGLKLIILKH